MSNLIKFITKLLSMFFIATMLVACGGGGAEIDTDSSTSTASIMTDSNTSSAGSSESDTKGTVTLSWTPTVENTDGSVLTDLSGYTIYYGTSPDALVNIIILDNPSLSSYIIENLTINEVYYFTITAFNSNALESAHSKIISPDVSA